MFTLEILSIIIKIVLVIVFFCLLYGINTKLREILKWMPRADKPVQEDQPESEYDVKNEEEPYSESKREKYSKWFYIFLGLTGLFLLLFALSVLLHGPAWSKAACSVALLLAGCCAFWFKVQESVEKRKPH